MLRITCATLLMAMLLAALPAQAQNMKEIIGHYWKGVSVMQADFTKSGQVVLTHEMKITLNSDNSISGKVTSTFDFDGVKYVCTAAMSGTYDDYNYRIKYKTGARSREDKLPYDLYWCNSWGELTVYKDADKPGYYLLRGTSADDCGGNSEVEFSDY